MNRRTVYEYIKKKYNTQPEYPFFLRGARGLRLIDESTAVFRHEDNRKWFALIMDVPREKLGIPETGGIGYDPSYESGRDAFDRDAFDRDAFDRDAVGRDAVGRDAVSRDAAGGGKADGDGVLRTDGFDRNDVDEVTVINLKVDDLFFRDIILQEDGILPAYHMNKRHWISVLLDGSVPEETVCDLIDRSFLATASTKKKAKIRPPKEWIIPANPKYFDIIHAFDDKEEINWKQGAGIRTGDTVYMYVGAPVSAIMYKCVVTEMNIPYRFQNQHVNIKALMKIRLQKRYEPDRFTFEVLKSEYGIYAVRGPRGIPGSLSEALG